MASDNMKREISETHDTLRFGLNAGFKADLALPHPLQSSIQSIHYQLWPIVSSSSSCASAQESMPPHQWESHEELGLFDVARKLIITDGKMYSSRAHRNRDIVDEFHRMFPTLKVPFNSTMVEAKLSLFKERWSSQVNTALEDRMLYTCDNAPIADHQATLIALFTSETTNAGVVSLTETEACGNVVMNGGGHVDSGCTQSPKQLSEVETALNFMAGEKRSLGRELYIFARMLNEVPLLLSTFNALPADYDLRRNTLIDVFKLGGAGVPEIPYEKLPQDFQ